MPILIVPYVACLSNAGFILKNKNKKIRILNRKFKEILHIHIWKQSKILTNKANKTETFNILHGKIIIIYYNKTYDAELQDWDDIL